MKPDNSQPFASAIGPTMLAAANEPVSGEAIESQISVGDLLRAGREKAGLSHGDIASRLRMGVKQVRALEEGDYPALPKGTFLRGFVRNFAKEVGVAPEEVLRLLAETHKEAAAITASPVVMPAQQNISVPTPGGELATPRMRALVAVVIAVILLAVVWYWWENVRPHLADGGRPKAVTEEKSVDVAPATRTLASNIASSSPARLQQNEIALPAPLPSGTDLSSASSAATPVSQPTPAVAVAEPVAPMPRPVLAPGNGILGFTFTDKSWIQVTDGNGKIVMDKILKAGEADEVVGRAPFSVVIGNAEATRMAYNGREIDLAPHTRASVARVTVK